MNFRALCGANLVTLRSKIGTSETLEVHRVVFVPREVFAGNVTNTLTDPPKQTLRSGSFSRFIKGQIRLVPGEGRDEGVIPEKSYAEWRLLHPKPKT